MSGATVEPAAPLEEATDVPIDLAGDSIDAAHASLERKEQSIEATLHSIEATLHSIETTLHSIDESFSSIETASSFCDRTVQFYEAKGFSIENEWKVSKQDMHSIGDAEEVVETKWSVVEEK